MPRNGSGTFNLISNSWNPAINGNAATATDWQALINDVAASITQSIATDGQTPMAGQLNMGGYAITNLGAPSGNGQSLRWQQLTKGPDIAAAPTIAIPVEGNYFAVTGTSTITSISDTYPGRIAYLIFPAGVNITHSGGLALPSGQNIVTRANDVIAFVNDSPGVWRVISYPSRLDIMSGAIPTGGFKNLLINSLFNINQRAVSGTVVLPALAYGHDRWKAGTGGCTYTFSASAGVTTITIISGTLRQFIEGDSVRAGSHTLSWQGTAQGNINGGSAGASPITATLAGGVQSYVEFGIGTLRLPQLEFGTAPTPNDYRPYGVEFTLCQRYYRVESQSYFGLMPSANATSRQLNICFSYPMRVAPTVTPTTGVSPAGVQPTQHGVRIVWIPGDTVTQISMSFYTADAEI